MRLSPTCPIARLRRSTYTASAVQPMPRRPFPPGSRDAVVPAGMLEMIRQLWRRRRGTPPDDTRTLDLAAIRAALDDDERALLVLRVDRQMSWNDVARVMASDDDGDSDGQLAKVAARLRKRFQSVKETIRKRAIATGLIQSIDPDPDADAV